MIIIDKKEDLLEIYKDISKDKRLQPIEMIKFSTKIQEYLFKIMVNFNINGYKIFYANMDDKKEDIIKIINPFIKNIKDYKYNYLLKDDVNETQKIAYYYEENNKAFYLILNLDGSNVPLYYELMDCKVNNEIHN